ncbi:MAG: TRAP transporter fused permease subunit [Geminicoccaceae bacterium]|nr:MAG: TRAP transporter fused permease subunit [Geminicoccaceae bacterium]
MAASRPEDDEAGGSNVRELRGWWARGAYLLGIAIALFHLYVALVAQVPEITRNALHFGGFVVLCALYFPFLQTRWCKASPIAKWIDLFLALAVAVAAVHLAGAERAIHARGVRLNPEDWLAAIVVIGGAIEFTRRVTGLIIPTLIVLAITYVAVWGPWVSGVFSFRGLSWETVLFRSIYGDDALFGTIATISATNVFLFILFGAFLLRSGAGEFVIDLARVVAGRLIGGPGFVAVIASGLTGTISGSVVANTASTGVITIPLMKRNGYKPAFAAGVEASASTGGQLMPPIMGAGAFVMASYTRIPYETIIAVALLPALLYFASVAYFVRIEAKRLNMQPMQGEAPSLKAAFRNAGASFVLPIIALVALLIMGYSPTYAAVIGIGVVVVSSWLTRHPMGPFAILEAMALGARNMILTAVLLCSVGLIVNVVVTAGVGNTFSLMIADWSGGNLLIAITLIALASLILGMGLPVTAAYIVLATLSAPALANMIADMQVVQMLVEGGIPAAVAPILMLAAPDVMAMVGQPLASGEAAALVRDLPPELRFALRDQLLTPAIITTALLSAHMIIFWLSQDSNVTPPVCLAAFTAAAIAKSPPMYTGLISWKIAKGLYIIPILFAYTPILSGDWLAALEVFAFALVGVYGIAAALQGCMEAPLNPILRLVAFAGGVASVWPGHLLVDVIGVAVVLSLLAWTVYQDKQRTSRPAAA